MTNSVSTSAIEHFILPQTLFNLALFLGSAFIVFISIKSAFAEASERCVWNARRDNDFALNASVVSATASEFFALFVTFSAIILWNALTIGRGISDKSSLAKAIRGAFKAIRNRQISIEANSIATSAFQFLIFSTFFALFNRNAFVGGTFSNESFVAVATVDAIVANHVELQNSSIDTS